MKGDGKTSMKKITKKLLVILVVAAMVFTLPLTVLADYLDEDYLVVDDYLESDYPEADDYPEGDDVEADYPEGDDSEAGYQGAAVAAFEDGNDELELIEIEPALGDVTVGDLLGFLYDDLQEIRDRVQADFDYILDNIGSFPGDPAELDDLINYWNQQFDALEVLLSEDGFEAFVLWLMDQGLTLEQAIEEALGILANNIYIIEYEILLDLRDIGFDVMGPGCAYCSFNGPIMEIPGVGIAYCENCWCYLCRGNADLNCRFCHSQEGDGICVDCGNPWYECDCGTNIVPCPICGELGCITCTPEPTPCDGCANYPCTCCVCFACNCEDCQCTDTECCDICAGRVTGGGTPTPGPTVVAAPQTGDAVQASLPLATLVLSSSVFLGGGLIKRRPKKD